MTGINPVTLRAWERRYGLIQPTRTETGHRLYSQADIEEVRSILGWIERGVAVSKVGKILARSQLEKERTSPAHVQAGTNDLNEWQAQLERAVHQFDERRMEQLYGQVFSSYPLAVAFQDIFLPVWQRLLLDQSEFGRTSEWLLFDNFLRARALQRLQLARHEEHELNVIVTAIPDQCRELELLVAGLLLGSVEVGVKILALGQPLDELSLVSSRMTAHAVVLYSNLPPTGDWHKRLARLALALECPLLLAGEMSEFAQPELLNSQIACLGNDGRLMQRRLQQYLAGHLDT